MIHLTLPELLHVAERVLGGEFVVRDHGLLGSALARPQTNLFGNEAYPQIQDVAAALLHSVARNHALVDGNKRLALAATLAFLGLNGYRLTLTNDEAYELVMAVAAGELDEVSAISARLLRGSHRDSWPGHGERNRSGQTAGPGGLITTRQLGTCILHA